MEQPGQASRRRQFLAEGQNGWLIAALALAAALPLLLPPIQGLVDLPAHLSAYHIANTISHSAALSRYYEFGWRPMPNLGVDLAVAALGPLLGDELATRLIVALIPALTAAGLLLIARVVHGAIPATSLVSLPLAYSYPLTFGFVNSSLAVALGLVAFAPWLALTLAGRTRARALLSLAVAPMLFFTHIIGYGIFGLMAGAAALAATWRAERPLASLRAALVAGLPLAWPLVFTFLWHVGAQGTTGGWINLPLKAKWTIGLLRDGWALFDVPSTIVLLATASLPLWLRRRFTFVPVLGAPALLLWIGAFGLPTRMMGSEFASVRLIPVACAIALLAVAPRRPLPRWATPAALAFVAARWIGNAAALLLAGIHGEAKLAALDRVTPGSRVVAYLGVPCATVWAPPRLEHLASYAATRRDAFVNDDFGNEAGQLLKRRPGNDPVLASLHQAQVIATSPCTRPWPDRTIREAISTLPWGRFDYLWLLDIPPDEQPRDARLAELWRGTGSILYRVRGSAVMPRAP